MPSNDTTLVTINARDFMPLARGVELRPGLIVLRRSGLSSEDQWRFLDPAIRLGLSEEEAGRNLINRVIEISSVGLLEIYDMPKE